MRGNRESGGRLLERRLVPGVSLGRRAEDVEREAWRGFVDSRARAWAAALPGMPTRTVSG